MDSRSDQMQSIWQGTVYLEAKDPFTEGGQEICSIFFPVRLGQPGQPDGRKKVEEEKINLNLSLILNVLVGTET